MNVRKLRRLAAKIRPEYSPCVTQECDDRDVTDRVKWVMDHRLLKKDRDLMVLYADRQSFREVGREIDCHYTTVRKNVLRIRAQIFQELEKL